MKRSIALVLACALVAVAPKPAPKPSATPAPPHRYATTAIVINNEMLPIDPSPRFEGGALFVPVRRTIEALGLQFNKTGKTIWTQIGSKTVSLEIGSRTAQIDGRPVTLDAAPFEIKDVLYAPLRFFTSVLGAQASYDRATNVVSIVAQLMGRSGTGLVRDRNGLERFGTVSAIDVNSDPPTLTLDYNASVKAIPIAPNAIVEMHDVAANVVTPGELAAIRPGDFARVYMEKSGRVTRVEDAFGSYYGRVAAVAGNLMVLDDGHVISPTRTTEVLLNGRAATLSDLRVGDVASVRYNVETNEVRSVLASRQVATTSTANGGPSIASVDLSADRALRPGDWIEVTVRGTPAGAATFDIGPYITDIAMSERSPGDYTARFKLPRSANFSDAPIIAHLRVGSANAADVQAARTLSVSGTPPGIADFGPAEGARVNSLRPAIYATFATDAVPVNPSSISMRVDGRDVTSECVRSANFVQYMPAVTLNRGPVRVSVTVADRAGNATTKTWTFTIK